MIFAGFSPDSIANRICGFCASTIVLTSDEGVRGGKPVPLKNNVDEALTKCPDVKDVIVVKRTGGKVDITKIGPRRLGITTRRRRCRLIAPPRR